ncbi:hypothetical protein Avbf_18454 [Armadillidium vulgare]|nr:hypothetical protein Avbf_18454 [Armadillidium vulgare]
MIVIIIHIFSLRRIIFKGKTIASGPVAMLESASEAELGYRSKCIHTFLIINHRGIQSTFRSIIHAVADNDEVYVSKRKVDEYENKIINQKKIIKSLQNEIEVLKSKNASLETDNNTLKEKLNRDGSNAGIGESSCTEMIKVSLQKTTKIEASLKTTLEEPSSIHKNKEKEVIFGSISFPENPFLTISRRPKNSLFVKDLVSLLWSDEDLSHRSLTGKKHYNSKEIKQPLTPEKRFAIEEAFKDKIEKTTVPRHHHSS